MGKAKVPTEVGEIKRVCAPSCKKNLPKDPCACTDVTKIITKLEVYAVFDGVRRYRAWFTPRKEEEIERDHTELPKVSAKDRFNEQGQLDAVKVHIPDSIYFPMARRALAIIKKAEKLRQKHIEEQEQKQNQAPPK